MPEMNQENNFNIENNTTPTVPVEPVSPVVNIVPEVAVEPAPPVEIPVVEVKEEMPMEAPVVDIAPVEIVPEVVPVAPVMVNEIPEVLPVNNEIAVTNEPVVTVTPDMPVVAETPVVNVNAEVAPVIDNAVVVEEAINEMPVIETAPAEEMPVIITQPEVENFNVSNEVAPVVEPTVSETNVVTETPVVTSGEENTVINGVASNVTPTVTTETTPIEPTVEPDKKEGKKVGLFIGLGVVVIILGVLLALYFFVYNKPQFLFKSSLDILKNKLVKTTDGTDGPIQLDLSFQTNINSTDEMFKPMFDNINKLYFETSIYVDLQNKIEFMKLSSKYKEQDFINADMFIEKENAYVKFNGIYDKYIKTVLEDDIFKENSSNDDATVVLEGLIDAIDESLSDEYFTKVEKTIELNKMVKKVTANTLVINGENVVPFLTDVVTCLKANDEFLKAYANMQGIEKDAFVASLDSFLNDISNSSQDILNTINYQVVFYTEGFLNSVVGFGVVYEGVSYDLYFVEGALSLYTTADNSTELLLEANEKDGKYVVNAYIGEDVYSVIIGLTINENPSFTKPDVSNSVDAENLSAEDSMTILGGLTQTPGVVSFMTDFEDIIALVQMMMGMGTTEPDMDLDMDLDMDYSGGSIYFE